MLKLFIYGIVGVAIGAASGALGGVVIGVVAGCTAPLYGGEIITGVAIGVSDGVIYGGPVGMFNGAVVAGIVFGTNYNISQILRLAPRVAAATGAMASLVALIGAAGLCIATICGTAFGWQCIWGVSSRAVRSRKPRRQQKHKLARIERVLLLHRVVSWIRDSTVTLCIGILLGAAIGSVIGAMSAVAVLAAIGFWVGNIAGFITLSLGEVALGSAVGSVVGAFVGAIAAVTIKIAGRSRKVSGAVTEAAVATGAAASVGVLLMNLPNGAPWAAFIGTVTGTIYGMCRLPTTPSQENHPGLDSRKRRS